MIPVYEPFLDEEEAKAVYDVVKSGWVSSKGKEIERFEKNLASYVGKKFGVSTSNGTTALHLALAALGIGPGDEVIVPDFTFVSPVNAAIYQGARPVLVDAETSTWGMNPDLIEKKITRRTRAIIVAHIYGNPARIKETAEIAEKHGIPLIEDCAESLGAIYDQRKVGTWGSISCFSFYGNKVITTGEGGMCITDDDELREKMKILRDHGMRPEKRYWHEVVGYNYRMTNIQATLGLVQLRKLDDILSKKRNLAQEYISMLEDKLSVQVDPPNGRSIYWLFSVLAKDKSERSKIMRQLRNAMIETRPFFFPVHTMPPYQQFFKDGNEFPVSNDISKRGLNLPSFPGLTTAEIKHICKIIIESVNR